MPEAAPSKKERKPRSQAAAAVMQPTVSQDDIARRAYEYYVARGYQAGDPLDDWLRAERELTASAIAPPAPKRQRRSKAVN